MQGPPLISPEALRARLHDPRCVVVDCRFDLADPDAGEAAHRAAHVPGARYAHLERDLSRAPARDEGRHPLPEPAAFARRVGAWGVDNDTLVAVYDEGSAAVAARLWWMLRWVGHEQAVVVDGGWKAWVAAGYPTEAGAVRAAPARFVARRVHTEWVVDTPEVARLQDQGALLVDARAAERFRGEREPIDPIAGHVPGARNFPFTCNLGPDGRFLPAESLQRQYAQLLGSLPGSALVAMCGSGVTACHLLLAMQVAGLGDGRLYAGSWSEWVRDPRRLVATGAET